ncbi:MAG: glycine cleavage system aminomethyltransferase GcvT [Acidobacteria bacterium]|nr:glycine cleavage system aminomethyltransferase GcvT [Acidobacteriota bacterium]MDW7983931.1 glycine cleavage system aminomethyltransferase GcvT [Acidobacteriota bacterium]
MQSGVTLRRTALYETHRRMGARMTSFAGFEMPVHYMGIIEEHIVVRTAVGVFDVSHMGKIRFRGPGSPSFVDRVFTNRTQAMGPGRAQYNLMLNDEGGILDDLVLYRLSQDGWLAVVNAATTDRDYAWLRAHAPASVEVTDCSAETALLAVQGPRAVDVLGALVPVDLQAVPYYHFVETRLDDIPVLCSRTGYTGEDGFEVFCPAEAVGQVWDRILEAGQRWGIRPCGLGARDTLRLEAGMLLYGQDMDEQTNPFEVGLAGVVKMDKADFIGKAALEKVWRGGLRRRLVGFEMTDAGLPRSGYSVLGEGHEPIGRVTSGTFAPYLKKAIGLALIQMPYEASRLWVDIRQSLREARVVPLPFYRRSRVA